jgi:glutaminase
VVGVDRARFAPGRRFLTDPENTVYSTGTRPPAEEITRLVQEAHERFSSTTQGEVSTIYPALARVPGELFGICVADVDGRLFSVGDSESRFAIMSVSKPFIFALVCDQIGATSARERIGANATGLPFNSVAGIERASEGRTNPMVNAGAIATTSLMQGVEAVEKWRLIQEGLSRFAGHALTLNEEVYESASGTNFRNRSIAWFLQSVGRLYCDPVDAADLYTKQCSIDVSARDLAVMGATLANGGFNPVTKEQVVSPEACRSALAVMLTAGLYETSGDWLWDIGLPGKSGISGGIVTVSPGKGGLGTFAPPLDEAGNSVKGQLVAQFLSQRLGLDLLA